MKKIIAFCLLITVVKSSFSQQTPAKFSVDLAAGVSIPVGKFGETYVNTFGIEKASGWAKPGPALQAGLNYHFKNVYGLKLSFSWQQNKQDEMGLSNYISQGKPPQNNQQYIPHTNSWSIFRIMVGGFIKIPLADKSRFYFQPGVNVGGLKTSIPKFSYTYIYQNSPQEVGYPAINLPLSLCYQGDALIGWQKSKALSFTFGASYFYSSPGTNKTINPNGQAYDHKTKFPVSAVNIMVGATIQL